MSNTVDERVVSMQFDNKNFENNVRTSMQTIDGLNSKLKFDGAEKGFQKIEDASSRVSLSGINKAVETVHAKFSTLDVMGMTVISNLTNSAIEASKRLIGSITVAPITSGFNEYEMKMGAIQTIMSSTGKDLSVVSDKLEQLNKYSDETIYSFSDMTTNIGKFTNAGINLDDSVSAIKGISNAAALSGANANEASRAMYNFSQALSSGYVKLIDWKSIELANMATVEFKNQLLESAAATGSLTKASNGMYRTVKGDLINATTKFDETLEQGWMTSKSLISTLKNYADETTDIGKRSYAAAKNVKTFSQMIDALQATAQSGWAATWETIVGDYNQSKSMFSSMTEVIGGAIGKISDARNNLLKNVLDSGWDRFNNVLGQTGISMATFQKEVVKTGVNQGLTFLPSMIEKYGSLDKFIRNGTITSKMVTDTLKRMSQEITATGKPIVGITNNVKELSAVVNKVIKGDFGNGAARVDALTKAGYNYKTVQSLVNQLLYDGKMNFDKLSDSELKNAGYTDAQIKAIKELAKECDKSGSSINEVIERLYKPSGRELLFSGLGNIVRSVTTIIDTFKKAWSGVFKPADGTILYSLLEGFNKLTSRLSTVTEHSDQLERTFKGLFSVIKLVSDIVGGVFSIGFKTISKVLGFFKLDLWDVTASVGDFLTGIKKYVDENQLVVKTINKTVDVISSVVMVIGKFFKSIYEIPVVQSVIKSLFSTIQNGAKSAGTFLGGASEWVSTFIGNMKSMDGLKVMRFPKSFSDAVGVVKTSAKAIQFSSKGASSAVVTLQENISKSSNNMTFSIGDACTKVKEKLVAFGSFLFNNVGQFVALGFSAAIIKIGLNVSKFVKSLSEPVEAFAGLIRSFSGVFRSFSESLRASATKKKAESVLAIAEAIGILAGSLFLISKVKPNRLWASVGAVGALVAMMAVLSISSVKGGKLDFTFGTSAITTIIGLSIGIALIGKSLKSISEIGQHKLDSSMVALVGILSAVMLATIAISSYAKEAGDLKQTAVTLLSLGGAVLIVSIALTNLAKIKPSRVGQVLQLMSVTFIGLIGLSAVAKKCRRNIGGLSISMLAIVGAVVLLSSAAHNIEQTNIVGLLKAFALMATMIIAIGVISKATKSMSPDIAKAGGMMIGLSASLILLIGACKLLGMMKPEELVKGVAAIGVLSLVFGAVSALSKFAGPNAMKAGVMILALAGSVTILSAMAIILGNINKKKVENGVRAVSIIIGAMALVVAVSGLAKNCTGTLIAIGAALGALVIGVTVLSLINPTKVQNGTFALASLMALMALIMVASSKMATAIAPLIALAAVTAIMGGVVIALSLIKVDVALTAIAGIALLLASATACVLVLSSVSAVAPIALITAGVMTLIIAGLALIIGSLSNNCDPTSAIVVAAGLSVLIIALSLACTLLVGAGAAAPAAITGIGVLIILVATMIGLVLVIGLLAVGLGALMDQSPNIEKFLDKGLPLLQTLAKNFGEFFGNIVAGFADAALSTLPDIAETLCNFMDKLQPFLTKVGAVDEAVADKAGVIARAITVLCAADVLAAVTSFFTGDADASKFTATLTSLGEGLGNFAKATDGIDGNSVKTAADAFLSLCTAASLIPNEGGLSSLFAGDNDIETFGEHLEDFGTSIKKYAKAVAELNNSDVDYVGASTKAASILTSMSQAANIIPNEGWAAKFFAGDNDIETFGDHLKDFGASIKKYATEVVELNNSDVDYAGASEKAATILSSMSKAASTIPNEGWAAKFFAGDNDIEGFGDHLQDFGESIKSYASSVIELNNSDVDYAGASEKAVAIITSISKAASLICNEGGLASAFAGDNTISKLGTNLSAFGESLVGYIDDLSVLDKGVVDNVVASTNSILGSLGSLGGITANKDYKTISDILEQFGNGISSYYNDVGSINLSEFTTANDTILNAVDKIIKMDMPDANKYDAAFASLAKNGLNSYTKSLNDGQSDVINAIKTLVSTMRKELESAQIEFEKAGEFAATGFTEGLLSKNNEMKKSVSNFGAMACMTLKKELDEHSPSKITDQMGKFFGEGFSQGLTKSVPGVKDKVSSFGSSIVDTFRQSVSGGNIFDTSKLLGMSSTGLNGQNDILSQLTNANASLSDKDKLNDNELDDAQNIALMKQDNFWTRLLKIKQSGIDADKYQSMKYLDFQKDILDQVKTTWDEYANALDSKRESIFGQVGIFDAIDEKEKISSTTLIKNMRSQLTAYTRFKTVITELNSKISNEKVRSIVDNMGVDSLDKLEALNSMVPAELDNYISMIEEKYQLSADTAYESLTDLRTKTETKLSNILGGIDVNADEFIANFDGTLKTLDTYVYKVITKMTDIGKQMVAGVAKGIKDNKEIPNDAMKEVVDGVAESARVEGEIHSPSRLMARTVGVWLTAGLAKGILNPNGVRNAVSAIGSVISSVADGVDTDAITNTMNDTLKSVNDYVSNGTEGISIRPVLDLTDIQNGANRISSFFNRNHGINVSGDYQIAAAVSANGKFADSNGDNSGNTYIDKSVHFAQTNESPKALSAIDIRRNTIRSLQLINMEV